MDWKNVLEWVFYGNSITTWTIALAVLVVTFGVLWGVRRVVARQLMALDSRTPTVLPAIACEVATSTRLWFLFLIAVRSASVTLQLPARVVFIIETLVVFAFLLQLAIWGNAALRRWLDQYTDENLATNAAAVTTMRAVVFMGRLIVWAVVILLALDNLNIKVTALVAGLGIGGIAVALAAQNILSDLFASLSIVIDKPFVIGDFIAVDDFLGTVDRIGLKTTRLRGLGGDLLVFSNADLLKSRIRNYRPMKERRIVFEFGLEYETPREALRKVPGIIREVIEAQEQVRFDRAHFKSFGSFRLDFEAVYYVLVPAYNTYMDIQQQINFDLFRRFDAEGIGFAYPAQRVVFPTPAPTSTATEAETATALPSKTAD